MNMYRSIVLTVGLGLAAAQTGAQAAEIKVLCSNGLREVMEVLAHEFEHTRHHKLTISYGLAAAYKRQIDGGEAFDLTVLTPLLIDDLIKQGKVVADSRAVIARSGMGIMVKNGAPKPDIATADAFRRTLREAKAIVYPREGASGLYFVGLIDRLAMTDEVKPRLKPMPNGAAVVESVAKTDGEIGILPVSEILPVRNVDLVGPFPQDVQGYIVMTAGVSADAKQAAAARELIQFLLAPTALPVIKAKGMEPG
jgi:molybdate transport system substrate-binding protein